MTPVNTIIAPALQEIRDAQARIARAQQQAAETIKDAIADAFAPLFEQYHFLGSIAWTQYTPFFNDGDTCVFSCHIDDAACNTLKDIEEYTTNSYGEDGAHFTANADEKSYNPGKRYNDPDYYIPNPDFVQEYADCREAVHEIVNGLRVPLEPGTRKRWDEPDAFDIIMLAAFGDHAVISVTREGIEVDSHDHD